MNPRLNQIPRRFITVPQPALSKVSVPPHGSVQVLCARWPDCQCDGDCIDILPAPSAARRGIHVAMSIATALIDAAVAAMKRFNWIFCVAMAASISVDAGIVYLVLG